MNKKGYIYLAFSVLAFSTMEVASKFAGGSLNPPQVFYRRYYTAPICIT